MNRAVIYSRVSTNEQTVENQLRVLREVAEKRGLEVVREISDEGISGAKGRDERQGFDELIKGSVKNEWDIILVWDVSRLGRSLKHLVSFLEDIQSAHCDMYIHQSGIDTSTASGKMMFGMLSVFSEFERSMIRERVIAGQQRAVANGVKLGRKTNVNDGIITAVYHMRQNNVPIKRIAKDLQIGVGTVYKILDKVA
ncbi:MAG: recombinase family protein [Proteobacteria bacterium]|jgi:DNA invertase Pin-like site-specific DNA recombinase|nr:recombinase family protein [Pseudomonadota bacterium]MBT5217406.1 recombinase family protein [Gammaproteobacteria bacterium]